MPPLKPVAALSQICLDSLSLHLSQVTSHRDFRTNYNIMRQYLLSTYPPSIREEIISQVMVRRPQCAVEFMMAMMDHQTRRLSHAYLLPWDEETRFWSKVSILEWYELLPILSRTNAVGLEVIELSAWLDRVTDFKLLPHINDPHLNFFTHLRNLREVTLQGMADNKILRVLGACCPALSHLDVTSSLTVDDEGVFGLCFEDPQQHQEDPRNWPLHTCCSKLERVGIQETSVSAEGVRVMLLASPKLGSLGGYIYHSSVGDVALSLLEESREGFQLNLEDLWDNFLPRSKATQLARVLPKLQELYTSGEFVHNATAFPELVRLTVDFDFRDWRDNLEDFLGISGAKLVHLEIRDQNHPLDLDVLGLTCKNLSHLSAKIEGNWSETEDLPKLKSCVLGIYSADTFVNFLMSVPSLESAEICMLETEQCRPAKTHIDDTHFSLILKHNSLQNLRSLVITSQESLGITTLQNLLNFCLNLRFVGRLHNWSLLDPLQLSNLQKEVLACNWDVILQECGADIPLAKRVPVTRKRPLAC